MAVTLGEAFVILGADDTRLRDGLSKAERDTEVAAKKMQVAANRVRDAWSKAGTAMTRYVTLPIVAAAGLSVKAAMDAEDAQMALAAGLAKTGDATSATMAKFQKFAKGLQETTVYSDEAVLSGMGLLKQMDVGTAQLEDATKAAIGLAATYRIPLQTAFTLVGRAAKGQTGQLTTYGIVLDQTGSKAKQFAELLKLGMSGMPTAESRARSASGQMIRFKNSITDLAASFGATLIPVLDIFVRVLRPVGAFLQGMPAPMRAVTVGLLLAAAAIGPIIKLVMNLGTAVAWLHKQQIAAAISSAVMWAKGNPLAAAAVSAAMIYYIGQAIRSVSDMMGKGAEDMDDYMKSLNHAIKQAQGLKVEGAEVAEPDKDAMAAQKKAAAESQRAIDAMNLRYREQAGEIMDIYNNLKASREEEEKRARAKIGWMGASDLWRGAAVAGAAARFGQGYKPEMFGHPERGQAAQFEAPIMRWAIDDWKAIRENTYATRGILQMLVDVAKSTDRALTGAVL